jgi:hypothetical protein
MSEFQQFLAYFSGYSALIPMVIGVLYFKHFDLPARWLFTLICISLVADLLSFYAIYIDLPSIPIVHFFLLFQVITVYIIISNSHLINKTSILLSKSVALFAVIAIIILFFIYWSLTTLILSAAVISSLSVIALSIIYLFDKALYNNSVDNIFTKPLFIFSALLLYHTVIMSALGAYKFLSVSIWSMKWIVYILFNFAIAVILFSYRPKSTHG